MSRPPVDDELAIRELYARYSWPLDTGDTEGYVTLLAPDAVASEETSSGDLEVRKGRARCWRGSRGIEREAERMVSGRAFVAVVALLCWGSLASGQSLSGAALVQALRLGGYTLVMRHAHAPDAPPSPQDADAGNTKDERQLDASGQSAARAMGAALRALHLPIGAAWSSPTFRARQTARLAGLHNPMIAAELGDNGRSMQAATGDQAGWLRSLANRPPRARTNTFVVTQYPNIKAAFGNRAADMSDGEAIVLRPSPGGPQVVGHVTMDEWPKLVVRR